MDGHEELAEQYRQRAAIIRAELSEMRDDLSRKTLENIASGYDKLAKIQDGLARTQRTVSEP